MKKILHLAKILDRCTVNRIEGERSRSGGSMFRLIVAAIGIVLFALLGTKLADLTPLIGNPYQVLQTLFLGAACVSIGFSFSGILNYLYMSDDLQVLLTLPYTTTEIICAKVLLASRTALLSAFVLTVPAGLAFGVTASQGVSFFVSIVLACICIPTTTISLIGIILIVAMRFIRGLHNRNTLKIIGGVLGCVLFCIIFLLLENLTGTTGEQASEIVSQASGLTSKLVLVSAFGSLMQGFSASALLIIVGISAVAFALFLLLVSKMYLESALAMQEASSQTRISHSRAGTQMRSPLQALIFLDYCHVRRNPAYLVRGILYPFIMPLLMVFIYLFSANSIEQLLPTSIHTTAQAIGWCTTMTCLITFVSTCSNLIACSAFSRTGKDYAMLKQMPFDCATILKAKQRLSLFVCAAGCTSIVVIGSIVVTVLGYIPWWCILYSLLINILALTWSVNVALFHDIKKVNFVWDSETDMLKNCTGAGSLVLLFCGMLVSMVAMMVVSALPSEMPALIIIAVMVIILLAGALLSQRKLYTKGLALIQKF